MTKRSGGNGISLQLTYILLSILIGICCGILSIICCLKISYDYNLKIMDLKYYTSQYNGYHSPFSVDSNKDNNTNGNEIVSNETVITTKLSFKDNENGSKSIFIPSVPSPRKCIKDISNGTTTTYTPTIRSVLSNNDDIDNNCINNNDINDGMKDCMINVVNDYTQSMMNKQAIIIKEESAWSSDSNNDQNGNNSPGFM